MAEVPTDVKTLGPLARSTAPVVRQFFVSRGEIPRDQFEARLHVIRRTAEKEAASWTDADAGAFYVSSFSGRTMVYKGLLNGHQLPEFYPDLDDERVASPSVLVHQRYSTNTLPTWNRPSLSGTSATTADQHARETSTGRREYREIAPVGDDMRNKAVIVEDGSTPDLDNVLNFVTSGRRCRAMMMMIPEAWAGNPLMDEDRRAFYEYHAALMEPWDGPAAMAFTDGRQIGATLDQVPSGALRGD
jgi:glutamate synthase domain-containing protein 1